MKKLRIPLLLSLLLGIPTAAFALTDSLKTGSERNVMLNAESGSKAREISIGIPTGADGAYITEDGLLITKGVPPRYAQWSGGNSYSSRGLMNLMESVITTGEIGYVIDSWTQTGGDVHKGVYSIGSSSNGLIKFDGVSYGPLSGKWHYSAAAYVNYDPTSTNSPSRTFVDKRSIFKFAITRRSERSEMNFLYKLTMADDNLDGYAYAPYIYQGKGKIKTLEGFRLGRDCYMPADDSFNWIDVRNGKRLSGHLSDLDKRRLHSFRFWGKYRTDNAWDLFGAAYAIIAPTINSVSMTPSGIDYVDSSYGSDVTYSDGTPFRGYMQRRIAKIVDASSYDGSFGGYAKKTVGSHHLKLGTEIMLLYQKEFTSSAAFAHEASASPKRLLVGGEKEWSFNTGSLYVDSGKQTVTIYGQDNWDVSSRFSFGAGIRLRYNHYVAKCANNAKPSDTYNNRVPGYYVTNGVARLLTYDRSPIDGCVSGSLSYKLAKGLYAVGDGFYSLTAKGPTSFRGAAAPTLKPIGNALARFGLAYDNSWLDLTGMLSYITFWNNYKNLDVTAIIGGVSETLIHTAQYGMGNWGFTLDGTAHVGGFKFHAMCTVQDPRYLNYENRFVFSDGSVKDIIYTGNYVTGISKVMLELDPSFSIGNWRLWLSARYDSRQYASRTNLAYFRGHWETFGGIDWNCLKNLKVSLSFVNILCQSGSKGSIDVADTIDTASELVGYVMAGSYIRPFTADINLTWHF